MWIKSLTKTTSQKQIPAREKSGWFLLTWNSMKKIKLNNPVLIKLTSTLLSMVLLGWVVLQSFFKYESYGVIRFLFLKGKWGLRRREPLLWIFYVRIITPMTNQRNSHAVVSQWNQITWDFLHGCIFPRKTYLKVFFVICIFHIEWYK